MPDKLDQLTRPPVRLAAGDARATEKKKGGPALIATVPTFYETDSPTDLPRSQAASVRPCDCISVSLAKAAKTDGEGFGRQQQIAAAYDLREALELVYYRAASVVAEARKGLVASLGRDVIAMRKARWQVRRAEAEAARAFARWRRACERVREWTAVR